MKAVSWPSDVRKLGEGELLASLALVIETFAEWLAPYLTTVDVESDCRSRRTVNTGLEEEGDRGIGCGPAQFTFEPVSGWLRTRSLQSGSGRRRKRNSEAGDSGAFDARRPDIRGAEIARNAEIFALTRG